MENLISKLTREFQQYDKMLEAEQKFSNNEELDENERWYKFMNNANKKNGGRSRIKRMKFRLKNGCAVKPCGKECAAWADMFIETYNHESMKNSKILVDDPEYLCHAAKRTPNPEEVSFFFYDYVNEYLKKNKQFRIDFLKSLYLNDNILSMKSIQWFINTYGFQKENEIITQDEEFYKELKKKFEDYANSVECPDLKRIKSRSLRNKVSDSIICEKIERRMRITEILVVFKKAIKQKQLTEEALSNGLPEEMIEKFIESSNID